MVLLLVMASLLASVGLVACGPKDSGATQAPTSTSTSTPSATSAPSATTPTQSTPSVGGSALPDVPLYPGMRQVQKVSQQFPVTAGYGKADVRAYETNDGIEKVVDFYKSQMPAKGWVESQWLDTPQFKNGAYSKNSEADIAVIWIVSGDGKTEVILMRGTRE